MTTAAADLDTDFELVHVHPRDLIIGPNVRRDPTYDTLVASVREVGVLQPITAFWNTDGQLVVVLGQRRTLAAIQADRDTVPVYVVDKPDDVHRLVDQYVENAHREDLTTADVVDTWHQLDTLGLDETAIAQRTTTPLARVRAGLRIARSPGTVGTIRKYPQTTLDQALVLAEFEGDKDATSQLVKSIEVDGGYGFDHQAQYLRNDRAEAAARDALEHELADAGVALAADLPYGTHSKAAQLTELKHGKQNLTGARHKDCEGHAAYLRKRYVHGEPATFEAVYLCREWKRHGHAPREAGGTSVGSIGSGTSTGPMSDTEKVERQRIIEGNKAWRAATQVRRRWLVDLAKRDRLDGAEAFIADAFAASESVLQNALSTDHGFWHRLVAGETPEQLAKAEQESIDSYDVGNARAVRKNNLLDELAKSKPARQLAVTAAMILAAWEKHAADPHTWRDPNKTQWYQCHHGRYLTAMATWGYQLASIEQALVDGEHWEPEPPPAD